MTEDTAPAGHRAFARSLLGSLSWTAGAQIATQIVTFFAGVLLARLLMPADFGIVGLALAYLAFLWLLGQVGFNSAIIYSQDLTESDLSTIYWVNAGLQVLLLCVAILLAPLAGAIFHDARVVPVIRVASLTLLATGLGGVQKALLEKRLEFRRLARNQLSASLAYAVVAVCLALAGFGVWALVAGRLLADFADNALAAASVRWRPRLMFDVTSSRRLFGYGGRVWAGNLMYYGQENIDNLVVGGMMGTAALGYYSFAFRLANVARYLFIGVVGRVMFPAFSRGRDELAMLRGVFMRINAYTIIVAAGLTTGLALVAGEFVLLVYGAKWLPSVAPLRILCVASGLYCAAQVTGPVLLATGKPGLHAKLAAVSTLVLTAGVLAGVRVGLSGVAAGVMTSAAVAFGLGQYFAARSLAIGTREYFRAVLPPVSAVGAMTLAVMAWRWLGLGVLGMSDLPWLVLAVVVGGLALVGTALLADRGQLSDIVSLWNSLKKREPDRGVAVPVASREASN